MAHTWEITLPKPPDDVWPILVDFTDRLDTANGEELSMASVEVYKLQKYDQEVGTIDLTNANRVTVTVERSGEPTEHIASYLVNGQPSMKLLFPTTYNAQQVNGIVLPESVVIGPSGGTPPNTQVSFEIRGGEDGARYAALVTATTNQGRQHSCAIRFSVESINLTG